MSSRQTHFSLGLRFLAAATLSAWVGALALCQSECCLDRDHENAAEPAQHNDDATAQSNGHDDDTPAPQHHDESTLCLSLKSLLHSDTGPSISKFSLHQLYALPSEPRALETPARETIAPFFRQANRRGWIFTPEVCLGPAFRSLAPPVIS